MTLATRCTACGTTFKVVQDQLKVSGGWVRCGRCGEVFNAIDGLFEFSSPGAAPPAADRAQEVSVTATLQAPEPTVDASADGPSHAATTQEVPREPPSQTPHLQPAEQPTAAADEAAEPSAPAPDSLPAEAAAPGPAPAAVPAADTAATAALPEVPGEPAPAFVLHAERAARWRRPGVRLALAAASLGLAVSLALQVALAYRDAIAAHWPSSLPLLADACAWADCTVEPLRRIGSLSVDSSGLLQLPGTPIYRLSVVLRNRADLELMLPAFDLALTDTRGEVVVRRVLTASELGSSSRTIGAGAELSLEASLDAGDRRISGYTIETFYP